MKFRILLAALAFLALGKSYASASGQPLDSNLYKLMTIEDHRDSKHPFLQEALSGKNPQSIARALLALGRIGDPASVVQVTPFMQSPDINLRLQAAFALGLLKNPDTIKILQEALTRETEGPVRAQIYRALGRMQRPEVLPTLEQALPQEKNPLAQAGLAMGFCFLFLAADAAAWTVSPEALQVLMNQLKSPAPLGIAAAWALARYKGAEATLPEKALVPALNETREPEAKAIAIKALGRIKTRTVREVLLSLLQAGESHNIRIEAANALVGHDPNEAVIAALMDVASRDQHLVRAAALTTLASFENIEASAQKSLREMLKTQPSPWLQGKAYMALAPQLPLEQRKGLILEGLQHPDVYVQREIITLLPQLGAEGLDLLKTKAASPSLLLASAALGVLHDLDPEQMNASIKALMLNQFSRHDAVITSLVIDAAGKFGWKDALPLLLTAAGEDWKLTDYPVQEKLMGTLGLFADPSTLPLIERNLQHPIRDVALKAAEAWQKITGKSLDQPLPLNHKVDEPTPPLAEIHEALASEVTIETSKGRIRLLMLKDAPLTVTKIVRWVQSGFYNGLRFHRVVPHWVVQGGDPRGDGEGGDAMIRDEVSLSPHLPYTVGIATAGKDTGSTQIFFNLGDNTRLDGSYTVFAQVIEGRDVVDRLELGDTILKAHAQPFRGR